MQSSDDDSPFTSPGFEAPLIHRLFGSNPRKGDLLKVKLVEKAIPIIGTSGLEGLTYDLLGKELNLTRSNVRYYFPSYIDLLVACVRYGIVVGQAITVERVKQAKPEPLSQLEAVVDGFLDWMRLQPYQVTIFWILLATATYDEKAKDLTLQIRESGIRRISSIISSLNPKKKNMKPDALFIKSRSIQNVIFISSQEAMARESKKIDFSRLKKNILIDIGRILDL